MSWNAYKYPDVKTWTVAGSESVASKIKNASDAHLIAAAPEMLTALESVQNFLLAFGVGEVEEINRIIKKARGES